jgi:hypothetical protein
MINTSFCPGTSSMIRESAAPDAAATYDHLPDSGWAGFPRGRSPKGDRCRRRTDCAAEGTGEHHHQRRCLKANLPPCLDHLRGNEVAVALTEHLINELASALLPPRERELSNAVPEVLSSWPSNCGPAAEAGRRRGRGGRRVGTADPGRGDHSAASWSRLGDRGDIVSLIINSLHELRQRWPVALSG